MFLFQRNSAGAGTWNRNVWAFLPFKPHLHENQAGIKSEVRGHRMLFFKDFQLSEPLWNVHVNSPCTYAQVKKKKETKKPLTQVPGI